VLSIIFEPTINPNTAVLSIHAMTRDLGIMVNPGDLATNTVGFTGPTQAIPRPSVLRTMDFLTTHHADLMRRLAD